MGVYEELGVRKIINAVGTWTIYGGSIIHPNALKAMVEAAEAFVDMEELHQKAGEVIAEITGAEAGLVTSGAAAGLTLATAACMAGGDLAKMRKLPDTAGLRDQVIIQRGHRNYYDNNLRIAGAKLVKVGSPSQTLPEELERAIDERTAAIAYFVRMRDRGLPLDDVIAIAKKHLVPTIVDAAAELPPLENLRKFIAMGADLVVFSGGKAIRGPNATGILCGRRDLVRSAAMQTYVGTEAAGIGTIGRPMKVGRESVVGLIVALRRFVKADHQAEFNKCDMRVRHMISELEDLKGVAVKRVIGDSTTETVPYMELTLDEKSPGITLNDVVESLKRGEPSIRVWLHEGRIMINPRNLQEGEEQTIVKRLREILAGKPR